MFVLQFNVETTYIGDWEEYPYEENVHVKKNIALCHAETSKEYLQYRGFKLIGEIADESQLEKFLQDMNAPQQAAVEIEIKRAVPIELTTPLQDIEIAQPMHHVKGSEVVSPKDSVANLPMDSLWWKG